MTFRSASSRLVFALSALSVVVLSGCASMGAQNVAIDDDARARIRSVRVNPVVAMPPQIAFFGQGQSIATLAAGPFAALMDDKLSAEPKAKLTQEIADNRIDVPALVAAAFAKHTGAEAAMRVVDGDAPADAHVDLTVNSYGFGIAHPGMATLYPVFSVSAVMRNAKGEIVWQGTDRLVPLNADNRAGHPVDDLLKDPQALREALASGSDLVSAMLVRNLMGLEVAQNVPGIQK
jgi:hypothetical protein